MHIYGHVHKYEAVLWTLEELRQNNFLLQIFRKHVF